jgi:glucose-6-phosphate dehydrogenase assembly protein OpcA
VSAPSPEQITRDLRELWGELGKSEQQGVLRACAMTLIVVTRNDAGEQQLGETIASLMHEHPSRAIVVRVSPQGDQALDARVFAQCWMPFGKRQQICCEQIELTAGMGALPTAAALIRGILVPDLPVVLYCRNPELSSDPHFLSLLPLASKVVIDSGLECDSAATLDFLNSLRSRKLRAGDLAWARTTPWREAIAEVFEAPASRRAIPTMNDVRILYAHAEEPVPAYYMAGWFMHVLGAEPHIRIARGVGPEYGGIARISIHGPSFEASVELIQENSADLTVNGRTQRLVFPPATEEYALREEMSVVGVDPVFENTLALAALLRGSAKQ